MRLLLLLAAHCLLLVAAQQCPGQVTNRYITSKVQSGGAGGDAPMDEISGVTLSNRLTHNGQPVAWVISDSGSPAHIVAYSIATGERLARINIGAGLRDGETDFEDITLGNCGNGSPDDCIFVADVGNNAARNSGGWEGKSVRYIYKIREPSNINQGMRVDLPANEVQVFPFKYWHDQGLRTADCEVVAYDPIYGEIILITKWNDNDAGLTRMYKFSVNTTPPGQERTLYPSGARNGFMSRHTWTRGSISKDGQYLILGHYGASGIYTRQPGDAIDEVLSREPCGIRVGTPATGYQHEAIGFMPDNSFLEISEGGNPDIWRTAVSGMPRVAADGGAANPGPNTETSNPDNSGGETQIAHTCATDNENPLTSNLSCCSGLKLCDSVCKSTCSGTPGVSTPIIVGAAAAGLVVVGAVVLKMRTGKNNVDVGQPKAEGVVVAQPQNPAMFYQDTL